VWHRWWTPRCQLRETWLRQIWTLTQCVSRSFHCHIHLHWYKSLNFEYFPCCESALQPFIGISRKNGKTHHFVVDSCMTIFKVDVQIFQQINHKMPSKLITSLRWNPSIIGPLAKTAAKRPPPGPSAGMVQNHRQTPALQQQTGGVHFCQKQTMGSMGQTLGVSLMQNSHSHLIVILSRS